MLPSPRTPCSKVECEGNKEHLPLITQPDMGDRGKMNTRKLENISKDIAKFLAKVAWKIVQSTIEECREAYAIWIDLAHEFLKQKNLEQDAGSQAANVKLNSLDLESRAKVEGTSKRSVSADDLQTSVGPPDQVIVNQRAINNQQDSFGTAPSVASSFIDSIVKLGSSLRGQSQVSLLLVITIAVILVLMQISILVLLSKPQQIHVIPRGDYVSSMYTREAERVALLDKQINHLKEEMLLVESLLDKMRHEHALLKLKLEDLGLRRKRQT